jgi:hypothetical protein
VVSRRLAKQETKKNQIALYMRCEASPSIAGRSPLERPESRFRAERHWVLASGPAAPDTAIVIGNRVEEAMFTDGPFLESKKYVAGFWIIEVHYFDVARSSPPTGRSTETGSRGAAVPGRPSMISIREAPPHGCENSKLQL